MDLRPWSHAGTCATVADWQRSKMMADVGGAIRIAPGNQTEEMSGDNDCEIHCVSESQLLFPSDVRDLAAIAEATELKA